jgi:hypothetical protein
MRIRKKLFEIKVYEMNMDKGFYRAESNGISVPSKTINGAIKELLNSLDTFFSINSKKRKQNSEGLEK